MGKIIDEQLIRDFPGGFHIKMGRVYSSHLLLFPKTLTAFGNQVRYLGTAMTAAAVFQAGYSALVSAAVYQ